VYKNSKSGGQKLGRDNKKRSPLSGDPPPAAAEAPSLDTQLFLDERRRDDLAEGRESGFEIQLGRHTGIAGRRFTRNRLVSPSRYCYHNPVNIKDILAKIGATEAPLTRQLLMAGLITRRLEEKGKPAPVLIGGLALSYYTREVYFTADIDLAYADRESLDEVLLELGFDKRGRYWVQAGLDIALEVPALGLPGEEAPRETVELEGGLSCVVIGLEDLIIDRLNACKHWNSAVDGEMTELLIVRYGKEIDWAYLEKKAALPENDTLAELHAFKGRGAP
jgi:hypothetical protein